MQPYLCAESFLLIGEPRVKLNPLWHRRHIADGYARAKAHSAGKETTFIGSDCVELADLQSLEDVVLEDDSPRVWFFLLFSAIETP